ncbi:helix-turn-helix domain-containing protein, partial [Sutterella wadsworthensis]
MSSPELNHSLIRLLITLYRTGSLRAAAEALRISTPSASY